MGVLIFSWLGEKYDQELKKKEGKREKGGQKYGYQNKYTPPMFMGSTMCVP